MKHLTNILLLLLLIQCSPHPVRAGPPSAKTMGPPSPSAIVAAAAHRHGIPTGYLEEIWREECSNFRIRERRCRNLSTGERGAFQMRKIAADEIGCNWSALGTPGAFSYEADCAARYLVYEEARCRTVRINGYTSWDLAQGAYNSHRCKATRYVKRIVAQRLAQTDNKP